MKLINVVFLVWLEGRVGVTLNFQNSPLIAPQNKEVRYSLILRGVKLRNEAAGESSSDVLFELRLEFTFQEFRHCETSFRKMRGQDLLI
jgi:hypothetical protein